MIEKLLAPILAPFQKLKSSFLGVKNTVDNIGGDKRRVQNMMNSAKVDAKRLQDGAKGMAEKAKGAQEKAKGFKDKAQGFAGQAQGAVGQAQGHLPSFGGQGNVPAPPGTPPPGMPPQQMMAGAPPQQMMAGRPGGAPMPMMAGGPPGGGQMPMMGGPPMGMQGGMQMGPAPGPGVRTMAIMAGGGTGAAIGWLVPLKGAHRGQLITLKPQSIIGKDPTCDVVFNDPFMSGRHATIRANNGVFVLEDHSTNGTWVNDKKIKTHELVDNDFVKIGQTIMKFKAL
jgi:hypothetical protein